MSGMGLHHKMRVPSCREAGPQRNDQRSQMAAEGDRAFTQGGFDEDGRTHYVQGRFFRASQDRDLILCPAGMTLLRLLQVTGFFSSYLPASFGNGFGKADGPAYGRGMRCFLKGQPVKTSRRQMQGDPCGHFARAADEDSR